MGSLDRIKMPQAGLRRYRVVDNIAPTGLDIQTFNAGTTAKPEAGDRITYAFSEPVGLPAPGANSAFVKWH